MNTIAKVGLFSLARLFRIFIYVVLACHDDASPLPSQSRAILIELKRYSEACGCVPTPFSRQLVPNSLLFCPQSVEN
jgi:hypothetical protein